MEALPSGPGGHAHECVVAIKVSLRDGLLGGPSIGRKPE